MSNASSTTEKNLREQLATLQQQLDTQSLELMQAKDRIQNLESRQSCLAHTEQAQSIPNSCVLAQAVEKSPASIVITDQNGNIEYVNPYFTQLTGYRLDEVIGRNPRFLKSGHTSPAEYEQMWATITTGQEWHGEFQNRKKDGSLYWEHVRIAPIHNTAGEIVHFIGIKEDVTERKQAVDALEVSEDRFRTLVNSMDDIVFTLDQQGQHTGVYGRWVAAHGLTPEIFLGKTPREILGDAAQVHETAHAQALTGERVVYEWESQGQTIQTSLSPIWEHTGTVAGVVGIGRDITTLKQIESQLRISEAFAHATLDALSAEIAILDEQGTILAVNDAWNSFATANDATLDQVGIGINYLDILNAVDPTSEDAASSQAVLQGIQQVIAGVLPSFSLEYPCHAPNEKRWFSVHITRFGGDGPSRVVVAHEDITARVLAEQQLVHTNAQLESMVADRTDQLQQLNNQMTTILHHISTPVLLVFDDGRIDMTNAAFNNMLGYPAEELLGQPFWHIFTQRDQAKIEEAFQSVFSQASSKPLETTLLARDGTTYEVEVSLNAVPDHAGYVVCTLYDISHLKELDRLKDQFISMVNHEIRTPISSIMLSASTLQQYFDRLPDARKQEKVTQILRQAQTLSELVTGILNLSRLDSRHGQHGQEMVDVGQALQDAVEDLATQAAMKDQILHVEIKNSRLSMRGEHFDLLRIWRNLLSNAIKYTPDGGQITATLLGASEEPLFNLPDLTGFMGEIPSNIGSGRYMVGVVNDNGHGMNADNLTHLFTRFYRGWATSTKITGTGLGLALVRDLLHLYGGDVAVKSELGTGTTFCFWLPLDEN